jgi:uncharacterized protein involved in exopolysaccharide biosynthesis
VGSALLASVVAALYVTLAPEWYQAEILLSPTSDDGIPQFPSELGGVASLVGLEIPESTSVEARAVLQSRDLARAFIADNDLLPVFFSSDWDSEREAWLLDEEDQPDLRDGVEYFSDNVRQIEERGGSELITLIIRWKDPFQAAAWANELVHRVNREMRGRALQEAQERVEYLNAQLETTSHVATQQALSRVLERELQKVVLAQGNDQYAFRVIDSAQVPKYPSDPQKIPIVAAAFLFGAVFAFLISYFLTLYRMSRSPAS